MKRYAIAATILIVAGVLGLVYNEFSYTKETHEAKLGPLEISVSEKETVSIPTWAAIVAIGGGAGALLLGFATRRRT